MNITNTKTGFTITASALTSQIMVTIVTGLSSTARTILSTYITNSAITHAFTYDGLYEIHQIIFSTVTSPTGYYVSGGIIYKDTLPVTDMGTLLDSSTLTKDSLKVIIISDIENCYILLLKKILESKLSKVCKILPSELEIKDLLQMSISAISYSAELGLVYQAQRIIESINGSCNICKTADSNLNCGCNA